MNWMENFTIRMAKKIATSADGEYSVGVVSHGLEIVLFNLLNICVLLLIAFLSNSTLEVLVTAIVYIVYRSFTGGVHFQNPLICFVTGNTLLCTLGWIASWLPVKDTATMVGIVCAVFAMAFLVNAKYAPRSARYGISEQKKKQNKRIILSLLSLGFILSLLFTAAGYFSVTYAYCLAVFFQSVLLLPIVVRMVERA